MAKQDLVVRFVGDTGNLAHGLDNLTGRFRAVTSSLQGIASVGAAVGAITFFKSAIDEAREAAKVTQQTEAVLKSTGGAAKVTAGHVSGLAERLSNLAGVDDEVIQSGANVLLTFTKVRNEVGKGNDVFDRGASLALDMSAALGTDLQGAMILVGKALNDPIKGMTALTRAGVQFTAAQKDEIKALTARGDLLGAQKIILGELQTQFGGMAAASADAGDKAKVAWENMAERIGGKVMPAVTALAGFVVDKLIPGIENLVGKLSTALQPAMSVIVNIITTKLVPAISTVANWLLTVLWPAMQRTWNSIAPIIVPVIKVIADLVESGLRLLWSFLTNFVIPALGAVFGWLDRNRFIIAAVVGAVVGLTAAWLVMHGVALVVATVIGIVRGAMFLLNVVMAANPIMLVAAVLGLLVGAFIYAWQNSATFRTILIGVWQAVQNAVSFAWNSVIKPVIDALVTAWGWCGTQLRWVFDNVIAPVFNAAKSGIAAVGSAFEAAVGFIKRVWDGLVNVVKVPVNFVIGIYNNGIIWVWNKVAEFVGAEPLERVNYLAGGGVLGGYAPGRDTVPALLSPGEAVLVPELVRQIGPANIMAANRAASGRPGTRVGFAGGGVIGDVIDWIGGVSSNVRDMVTDPIGTIKRAVGDSPWIDAAARVPAKAIDAAGDFLWEKIQAQMAAADIGGFGGLASGLMDLFGGGGGSLGAVQRFALAQRGKRYQWGATGPSTWDCSGLVGALAAVAAGKNPYQRYMTTATMGVGRHGMKRGRGQFTVYLGPGHTAANIGGLHAEAYGGNGVPLAIGRVGTPLSFYHTIMHLFGGGGLIGNLAGLKADPAKRMESFLERGWPEPPRGMRDGGWLEPGRLAYNETSRPEAVLTQRQLAGMGGSTVEKHYHLTVYATNSEVDLRAQFRRLELLDG